MKASLADPGPDYGPHEAAMRAYCREGEKRALALPNRGPLRFTETGDLHPEIIEAWSEYGFYVLEGVIETKELDDIERDLMHILDRLPVEKGSPVDASGRPALGAGCKGPNLFWSKPLGDPFGGTGEAAGRHPVRMFEPLAPEDGPAEDVYLILGVLQFSEACLRLYGHPRLLAAAATLNGADFVPFNEAMFIKKPGLGASVAWHQDGVTHWDHPQWDSAIHGFTFQVLLYGSTAANAVWVVPGSHRLGKCDLGKMVEANGSERLRDAVPYICSPGDVVIHNRQMVHGSFANTSPDWRVSVTLGFHRRASVLGVQGGGLHNTRAVYDDQRIQERSKMIGYAIDARRKRFPLEVPYAYQPLAGSSGDLHWDDASRHAVHDYNLLDFSI